MYGVAVRVRGDRLPRLGKQATSSTSTAILDRINPLERHLSFVVVHVTKVVSGKEQDAYRSQGRCQPWAKMLETVAYAAVCATVPCRHKGNMELGKARATYVLMLGPSSPTLLCELTSSC